MNFVQITRMTIGSMKEDIVMIPDMANSAREIIGRETLKEKRIKTRVEQV